MFDTPAYLGGNTMSNTQLDPEVENFLKDNDCMFLHWYVAGMSYRDFVQLPRWTFSQWGAPAEVAIKHADLMHQACHTRGRTRGRSPTRHTPARKIPPPTVPLGAGRDKVAWGRTARPDRVTAGAAVLRPTPPLLEPPVVRSHAQVLGDRCCANRGGYRGASRNPPPPGRGAAREPSPSNVYRTSTTTFF